MDKKEEIQRLNLKIESKDIDPRALFIIQRLNDLGYEAFVVGGCIRNLVMGERANDWDVTTKAKVEEMDKVFKDFKVIPVGKRYGTVTVVVNSVNYQVTTFRGKGRVKSRKQLDKSNLISDLFEDLRHRDFTINALAWGEESGLIDYFNGMGDIRQKVVRGVENSEERIKEDSLRMLRAVRLACELDFEVDKATLQAIEENSPLVKKVSQERIRDELIKILLSNSPKRGIKLLQRLGLLQFILPELERGVGFYPGDFRQEEDLFEYITDLLNKLPSNLVLRLTALLGDVTRPLYTYLTNRKEVTVEILRRLKFKKSIIKQISILVQENWRAIDFLNPKNIRQIISRVGEENILSILELKKADFIVSKRVDKINQMKKIEKEIREILHEKPPLSLKDLAINGRDLIHLGYQEGKEIGETLKKILKIVIDTPELNNREILLEFLKSENSNFLWRRKQS